MQLARLLEGQVVTAGDPMKSDSRLVRELEWLIRAHNDGREGRLGEDLRGTSAASRSQGRHEIHVDPVDWEERSLVNFICRTGQILVDDSDLPRVLRSLQDAGIQAEVADSLIGGVTLVNVTANTSEVLDYLDAEHGIGVATPNHVLCVTPSVSYCPATEPDAPGGAEPWPGVGNGDDGLGVRVAVVDTGFLRGWEHRPDLPWLAGIDEYDVDEPDRLPPSGYIDPYAGHGTFVAGVVRCIAPGADITVDGVLKVAGVVDEATLVKEVSEALTKSPDVINLSAGCYTRKNVPPKAFVALWENRLRHHKGVALVAAAGNDHGREPFWPAAFPWAVSVGALAADGRQRAEFSNYGGWVNVFSPGVDIVNAYCEGEYRLLLDPDVVRTFKGMCKWSGTSFSTPIVTGLIAARMSRTGENARQAADALLEAARGQFLPGVGPRLLP